MVGLLLSTVGLVGLLALLAAFVWHEDRRVRTLRARIFSARRPGRPVAVLYRSEAWDRASVPEAVGMLYVEAERVTLVVETLDGKRGAAPPREEAPPAPPPEGAKEDVKEDAKKEPFALKPGRTELVFARGAAIAGGLQVHKHAWVVVERDDHPHFIAPDPGLFVIGSEELAHDLHDLVARALAPPDAPPPERPAPLLVVGRRGPVELWRIPAPGLWLVALVATGALAYESVLVRNAWYEWLPPTELVLAGVIPGTSAVYLLARRYLRRRWARTEFFDDRIVFTRERPRAVPWSALTGYRDDSVEYVQLLKATGTFADPDLAVPTRDEGERVAVLRLLDDRGVRRIEGQPTLRDVAAGG